MTKFLKIFFAFILFAFQLNYMLIAKYHGIYDDAVRIVQIEEDITTIRKAMNMINDLW